MKPPEDIAEDVVAKVAGEIALPYGAIRRFVPLIADAIRADRIEALEDAAKIASEVEAQGDYVMGDDGGSYWQSDAELTKDAILSAIRARIEELRK